MSFAGPSNYQKFQIIKTRLESYKSGQGPGRTKTRSVNEKKVRIEGKIVGVNYFESVYSPMVTASFLQEDTGGTTSDDQTGFVGTLKDTLPVEGFEDVLFKIGTGSGYLNFNNQKNKCFVISGSPYNIDTMQKQTAFFPLVSKNAIKSANSLVKNVYSEAPISQIVEKILKDKDGMSKGANARISFIEPTKNKLKVVGDNQPALDTILKLCNKSQPEDGGDPGYFFFETQSGYHFESIQGMIKRGIEEFGRLGTIFKASRVYRYGSLLEANLDNNANNFKILMPPVVRRDQDQINAIRTGKYSVNVCTLDTTTQVYTEKVIKLDSNKNNTFLAKVDNNPQNVQSENDNKFCKTYSYVLSRGEDSEGVSDVILDNPSEYEPRAMMKYGMLHSQLVDIQIPCNVKLEAGMVIKLLFENITQGNKVEHAYNEHRSGFYLILHLCHHFDSQNSFTSLTLARDGYGLYSTKK
tara:strand:- start:506 stop:1906 length:1401 start_codon:yes stop_codon:yes gene_type:complete